MESIGSVGINWYRCTTTQDAHKYRLYDEKEDLFHRGNRCIDVPSAQREGVYFGFQGEINLVLPDGFIV